MPPVPATVQLRRLLVMIPWLVERGRVSLADLAAAFDVSVEQAEADVLKASMLRAGGDFTENYVNVFLDDDGFAYADPGDVLTRPPQLSAAQGFALLASAQGLLDDSDPPGPLRSALEKLAGVLDTDAVDVDLQRPANLDLVRDAVDRGERLRGVYYAAWRDEETERDIDPYVVFQRHGRWYVEAMCHLRGGTRRFRIDRFRSLVPTGGAFEPVRSDPPPDVFSPGDDAVRVVLDLPTSARWVVEAYDAESVEVDGRLRVTLHVLGTAWLERVLLKVGADGHVVEPASLRSLGRDAATRLLAAYR